MSAAFDSYIIDVVDDAGFHVSKPYGTALNVVLG